MDTEAFDDVKINYSPTNSMGESPPEKGHMSSVPSDRYENHV